MAVEHEPDGRRRRREGRGAHGPSAMLAAGGEDAEALDEHLRGGQVAQGAHVLDVNMGVPLADEAELLRQAVILCQETTDLPLCIDSSVVEALEAGLSVYQGKALVNSVTCERERLERLLVQHGLLPPPYAA